MPETAAAKKRTYKVTGKYNGTHAAKMQKKAEEIGCNYIVEGGKGKFVPKVKTPEAPPAPEAPKTSSAAPVTPKAPDPPKPPVTKKFTKDDTAESDFIGALKRTVTDPDEVIVDPAAATEKSGEKSDTAATTTADPAKTTTDGGAKTEEKSESKEDPPPPGWEDFDFKFDDEDVEVMLDMLPLLTIPISSLIAWFFNRTLIPEQITMPEWKRKLLRPGVKHYGGKLFKMICTPEFFWTALVAFILFDAFFASVKNTPEGGGGTEHTKEHEETKDTEYSEVA